MLSIAGKAIVNQFHLLFRGTLEWEQAGVRVDKAFNWIVVVKVYVYFSQDAQFV